MRHLIWALCLLLPALPAQATIIELDPSLVIASFDGPSFTVDNFEILTRTTNTSVSGSGSAASIVNDWNSAEIRTALGAGPGEATASLTNIASFDLVFDGPGEIVVDFRFGFISAGDLGLLETDPGDNSFAVWDLFIDVEGVDDPVGESQEHRCIGGVPVVGNCINTFDTSLVPLFTTLTDDLRLTVTTTMRFDIGVSRAAVAVSEPGVLAMLLLSLAWIGRRKLTAVERV